MLVFQLPNLRKAVNVCVLNHFAASGVNAIQMMEDFYSSVDLVRSSSEQNDRHLHTG